MNGDDLPTSGAFLKKYNLKRAIDVEKEQVDGSWKVEGEKPAKLDRAMIVVPGWVKDGGEEAIKEFKEDIDEFVCANANCKYIVKEPMHCEICDRYICKSCLKQNGMCPNCNDQSRKP